ncbi:MAG TPA: hypothetical protein VF611_21450, partial [Pyrinomonadaceae bacterium]
MAETIQSLFITPPIAIARLGGSTTPQVAFKWVESPNPRSSGETTVAPDWSLTVQADGTVEPVNPENVVLQFRDGALIRPVCPFFEVWALLGDSTSDPSTWHEEPLTPALLAAHGATSDDLVFQVNAQNWKASRRTHNPALQFGTFPSLQVRASDNSPALILAVSPPDLDGQSRMIPPGRSIPFGSFQVMKSRPQPAEGSTDWPKELNVEVIRFRFTPAQGHMYGPPQTAQPVTIDGRSFIPVDASRAFLNPDAGWVGFDGRDGTPNAPDAPWDTYDGAEATDRMSVGVVDDTCEARIEASLRLPGPDGRTLTTAANVFVAPPDFAPDRRPFLSLADELNDRAGDGAERTAAMTTAERDAWVQDLFERVYETASLFNIDFWRRVRGIRQLPNSEQVPPIPNDRTRDPVRAMGGRDRLRNRLFPLQPETQNVRLPLTKHALMRHRVLSDLENLRAFIAQNPGRLAALVRQPFEVRQAESPSETSMQMPPFMRNSNAQPLALAAWQYALLMDWVRAIESPPVSPLGA